MSALSCPAVQVFLVCLTGALAIGILFGILIARSKIKSHEEIDNYQGQ